MDSRVSTSLLNGFLHLTWVDCVHHSQVTAQLRQHLLNPSGVEILRRRLRASPNILIDLDGGVSGFEAWNELLFHHLVLHVAGLFGFLL